MLKIISAGAGSGKTYRLTQEMTALLKAGTVRPAGLIATTFTNKAAAELRDRVRIKLLEEGLTEQANALSNALIGTVHGLGVKLLQRFAFEAGVSPQVEIISDEDHQRLFNLSMAAVISVETIERLEALCRRLGLEQMGEAYNWRKDVRQLVEVIRANDFSKEELQSSKAQSFASLAEFLPSPTGPSLPVANEKLLQLLDSTQEALDNNENDGTKTTLSAAQTLRNLARELKQRGELSWPKWAFLCKFGKKVGAKSRELVNDLTSYAATHTELPDFQLDIKSFIELIFDCAQAAITEYDRFKKSRGQIDYTDMEVLVLRLLENSEVRTTLSEELDLLMVDEFQDTSPIQLSIFLKLSSLANQSIWVGDPKQSIYGFRGAEPRLMAAVIQAAGGIRPENIQAHSWRSREDLVYLTNSLFVRAFPDIQQEEVRLIPRRTRQGDNKFGIPPESTEQANSTALWHWHYELDGKGQIAKTWTNNVLARSIKDLLDNPPVIRPKSSKEYRQLIPSDVAVLCRSNYGCVDMARALQQAGLAAAVARNGLLETAESVLLLACMKYMLDGEDSLSAAEIMLLASRKPLVDIVDHRMDYLTEVEEAPNRYQLPTWGNDDSFIAALEAMRKQTQEFSPAELLNHILEVLDLRRIIVAWGNGEQRLANIDELRRLALAYEE
ncbi:MAG: UvrD-helicase domain-containing protein, partial [Bacteroidota bacterium]